MALASTLVFKKGIEAEAKSDSMKLGLVGLLDRNISFQATAKKECAIYFNAVVHDSVIASTVDLLLKSLRESNIAQHYRFVPPKVYESQLYMIPYGLGFLRDEINYSLEYAGYDPKHLRLLCGKQGLNSASNIVGTHGNVLLKTEVGSAPLTFIMSQPFVVRLSLPLNVKTFMVPLYKTTLFSQNHSVTIVCTKLLYVPLCKWK